jgi:RHH-type rel operon transcriptional repressor/antitoxin RelB
MTTTMTIRLDHKLKQQLDQLAKATSRSKSFLAVEALRDFVEINQWQIQEITDALKEADDGDFASEAEVNKVSSKWSVNAG